MSKIDQNATSALPFTSAQPPLTEGLLDQVIQAVESAGKIILQIYSRSEGFGFQQKVDDSPVTEADELAEEYLLEALAGIFPDVPIVAEESVSKGFIPAVSETFWLVDPLDGTREFINRNGEFTVNVALIHHGRPVLGVVLAPALQTLFAGFQDFGAFRNDSSGKQFIHVRKPPASGLTIISSRSHGDPEALSTFLSAYTIAAHRTAGSSLKICLVADGNADLYPRFGRTMEWDIAAGHAILSAAGGELFDIHKRPLVYGKPGFENPHFLASGFPLFNTEES